MSRRDKLIGEIILRIAQLGAGLIFLLACYALLSLSILAE